jgi:hypothetical protein
MSYSSYMSNEKPWWIITKYPNVAILQGTPLLAIGICVFIIGIGKSKPWLDVLGVLCVLLGAFSVLSGVLHRRRINKGNAPHFDE